MFKKIRALIEPLNLNKIEEALEGLGVKEVTISKCRNFGAEIGSARISRGKKLSTDFLSELRLEMVVDQEMAARVIETIQKAQRTNTTEDCKVFVLPVEKAIWI
jgi:nitrogen regulatory protein P-II 1